MKTEYFDAKDESGNTYQVVAYSRQIDNGPPPIYGLPEFRLANGGTLTPVEAGRRKFAILKTGVVITII